MLILHAGAIDDQLFLWGEALPEDAAPVPSRSRRPKASLANRLPYDAGPVRLGNALDDAGSPLGPGNQAPFETVSAWLPTVAGAPVASSPLIAAPPVGAPALAAWQVTALPLSPEQSVQLLCAAVGKETLAPGVVVGKTLAYWSAVLRFAGTLVARQRFLPAADGPRARWKPVLLGPDLDRLAAFAKAMPPACRALSRNGDGPPQTGAGTVLNAVLDALTDNLVRSALPPPPAPKKARKKAAPAFESVHDAWLHALRSPDTALPAADAPQLAKQIEEWRRPIAVAAASPFRLCFRLEEPPEDENAPQSHKKADAEWYVRYLLQAVADPSLLVPAEDVWTARGRTLSLLQRNSFHPREYLLTSLGQASTISPQLEASLKTETPAGYALDATGAHDFLTEKAWMLEQAGFGVLLPAWWTRKGTKVHVSVRAKVKSPKMQGGSGMGLNVLVSFNWEVAIGDQALSRQELETLARLKAPLVKVRGQWVQLTAEEIKAALDFWKQKDEQQATLHEVVKMTLGAAKSPGAIEFAGVEADGWVGDFLAQLEGRGAVEELPAPGGFQGTLRPYQARGYSWLAFLRQWGLGACLADDMGLTGAEAPLSQERQPRIAARLVPEARQGHDLCEGGQQVRPGAVELRSAAPRPRSLRGRAVGRGDSR